MKNKLFLILAASLLLVGCGAKQQSNNQSNTPATPADPTEPTEPADPTDPTDPVVPGETQSVTITFTDNTAFTTGSLANDEPNASFVENFNKGLDSPILNSMSVAGYIQMATNDSNANMPLKRILQFGSKSAEGNMALNFAVKVTAIEVVAQAYWKSYVNQGVEGFNIDSGAAFYVGSDTNMIDLDASGSVEPEKKTASYSFNSVNSVNLYTKELAKRVYIHSIKVTYIA